MSTMMDCWKRTDFGPSSCASETAEFHKCMAVYEASQKEIKELRKKGLPQKEIKELRKRG